MSQLVKVWDLPTRLFHWSLVLLLAGMWYSGEQGGDFLQYHIWCGLGIAGLLIFRLIWGLVGSQTARFSYFIKGPRNIVRYLRGEVGEGELLGHNPLGGLMVLVMLLALLVQVVTGLFAADVDSYLYDGPLAKLLSSDWAETFTSIHQSSFNIILGLVALHITAILAYRILKRQNLVTPMITGYKPVSGKVVNLSFRSLWRAVLILLLSMTSAYCLLMV
ncbi:cytochrome b/b6 domain-containing protein [Neisseriaceae bacterium TC5R-5]|nr:cytochrome b/b6 domain-containing protein [Neisseriaceae bacterium TC5R-5]